MESHLDNKIRLINKENQDYDDSLVSSRDK